ncbi:MAG TPA: NAD(+)/NADH kinase [Acidimicrobiales bacterium]
MGDVVLVIHPDRPEAVRLAVETAGWLGSRGHGVRISERDAATAGLEHAGVADDMLVDGATLAVSLGGDGTMLRAVELAAPHGVPVLGVNLGHLGYLTEVEPAHLALALERFWAGEHTIEERMTLEARWLRAGRDEEETAMLALNEVVVEKGTSGNTVNVAVGIDGRPFLTYAADGLIVATPTGSTAYNLSARGPIVSPHLRAILITPVSPHMLFDRSLVLEPEEEVRLDILDGSRAELLLDGRSTGELVAGDAVTCRAATPAKLVSFGARDFRHILKAKFGLADR